MKSLLNNSMAKHGGGLDDKHRTTNTWEEEGRGHLILGFLYYQKMDQTTSTTLKM